MKLLILWRGKVGSICSELQSLAQADYMHKFLAVQDSMMAKHQAFLKSSNMFSRFTVKIRQWHEKM